MPSKMPQVRWAVHNAVGVAAVYEEPSPVAAQAQPTEDLVLFSLYGKCVHVSHEQALAVADEPASIVPTETRHRRTRRHRVAECRRDRAARADRSSSQIPRGPRLPSGVDLRPRRTDTQISNLEFC